MPRSATVNQEMRERSRERILAAALEVFAAKGFEAASISEITAAAGVSRGLVSYYFATKEELAAELLDRWLDGIAAILTIQGTPDERLAGIIDGALMAAATTLPIQRLAISLMMQPEHPRRVRPRRVREVGPAGPGRGRDPRRLHRPRRR